MLLTRVSDHLSKRRRPTTHRHNNHNTAHANHTANDNAHNLTSVPACTPHTHPWTSSRDNAHVGTLQIELKTTTGQWATWIPYKHRLNSNETISTTHYYILPHFATPSNRQKAFCESPHKNTWQSESETNTTLLRLCIAGRNFQEDSIMTSSTTRHRYTPH